MVSAILGRTDRSKSECHTQICSSRDFFLLSFGILHLMDSIWSWLNGQDLKSCSILINSSVYALACLWEREAEYHGVAKAQPDED